MQNSGLATSLATVHFAQYPLATIPGAVFSVWHNISGAIIANIYSRGAQDKTNNKFEVESLSRDTDGTDTKSPSVFTFNGKEISTKKKEQEVRYGNYSSIRCEIRCGTDTSKYEPVGVVIDYL